MDTSARVAAAIRNYGFGVPSEIRMAVAGDRATPDPLGYALGWIAACAVVGARYHDAAIDALPVYHPERGWDRFLLTRRVSCDHCADEPADAFGTLLIDADTGLTFVGPNGAAPLPLGALYCDDTERAERLLLEHLPSPTLPPGEHAACPHARSHAYPALVAAITDVIVTKPGVIAARELFIDDQAIDGVYHPLYLHTGVRTVGYTYDWLAVSFGERTVFLRIQREQVIHEVAPGVWRSETTTFSPDDPEAIRQALRAWLQPDAEQEAPSR